MVTMMLEEELKRLLRDELDDEQEVERLVRVILESASSDDQSNVIHVDFAA